MIDSNNIPMNQIRIGWQQQLRESRISSANLAEILKLDSDTFIDSQEFPVIAPANFIARMKPKNPEDPLLLQVISTAQELAPVQNGELDPLQEKSFELAPGLLQKYNNRVLWLATQSCPINCRYCFRRNHQIDAMPTSVMQSNIALIAQDAKINEVILSGGDPLMLSNEKLGKILDNLESIDHLENIRIHTRFPIVIPDRVDDELLRIFEKNSKSIIVVLHTNHPNELSSDIQNMAGKLSGVGVKLFSQSVLLKKINDDATVLVELCQKLFAFGIQPYYLHMFDRVLGADHFAVDESTARNIYSELLANISGYMAPKFVVEQPNQRSKTVIGQF